MQIETALRFHFTASRVAITKTPLTAKPAEGTPTDHGVPGGTSCSWHSGPPQSREIAGSKDLSH